MKDKFSITGMSCAACQSRVEKAVNGLDGVSVASVNLLTNSMVADYDENVLSCDDIIKAVEKAGYGAKVVSDNGAGNDSANKAGNKTKANGETDANEEIYADFKRRLIVSFAFLIPLMYVSMGHMVGLPLPGFLSGHSNAVSFAFTQFLLCIPVLYVNRIYFKRGFKALFHLNPNMDSLIAVGSSAALIYGIFAIYRMSYALGSGDMEVVMRYHHDLYFESSVMILSLITVGKFLEAKSKGKTSEALRKLIDMAPKKAIIEVNGDQKEVSVDEVKVSDIVIVKPGSNISVDGIIIEGNTSVDEAAITGESIPVEKVAGDEVIAATINKTGFVKVKASRVGADTTFSKIIKLVDEASASKAPIAKIADKISGIFVPVVMAIAVVTFVIWLISGATFEFALSCAICVLVISCPCALGLATPVAIMVGTGKGAENGILIKSGEALEVAHSIDTVVFDKTGTITIGKPVVTDISAIGMGEDELLDIAYAIEEKSEHPLANAIVEYSKEHMGKCKLERFNAISGKGVEAFAGNSRFIAGNEKFINENGIKLTENEKNTIDNLANEGKTPLLFARDSKLIGIIAVADVIKESSPLAIRKLKSMGIKVIMLTGDNKVTANGIGKSLELDDIIAEVLPQDKESVISELKKTGRKIAMVGDGINDAPALVSADVGIAISNGTDVAIESADIILMKNDLLDVVTAIRLSKSVIRNIKENLFWAFFYNVLGIPLAAGVYYNAFGWKLNPMFGAAAMSLSSVFVVTNALRLRFFKKDRNEPESDSKNAIGVEVIKTSENNDKDNINNISNKKTTVEKEKENMIVLKVDGMMCKNCVAHVEKALNSFYGVSAKADLESKLVTVDNPENVSVDAMIAAVKEAGYDAVLEK
ncbi:MAG: heavy metal translocating P-type ATPase [Lachnospiraceae bacterium]|nr:heavy metal translocating P-type ATPase [Lachnospiraceae bacterium]